MLVPERTIIEAFSHFEAHCKHVEYTHKGMIQFCSMRAVVLESKMERKLQK